MPTDQHAELAERGAEQLAEAMTTEQWPDVRDAVWRMLAVVDPTRCAVLVGQLDQDNDTLGTAAVQLRDRMRDRIAGRWEVRLVELLGLHPAMQDGLTELIGRLHAAAAQSSVPQAVVHNQRIEAREHGTAFGAQDGNVYYYASPTPPPTAPPSPAPSPPSPAEEPTD
jgi:hypothetical protein